MEHASTKTMGPEQQRTFTAPKEERQSHRGDRTGTGIEDYEGGMTRDGMKNYSVRHA